MMDQDQDLGQRQEALSGKCSSDWGADTGTPTEISLTKEGKGRGSGAESFLSICSINRKRRDMMYSDSF